MVAATFPLLYTYLQKHLFFLAEECCISKKKRNNRYSNWNENKVIWNKVIQKEILNFLLSYVNKRFRNENIRTIQIETTNYQKDIQFVRDVLSFIYSILCAYKCNLTEITSYKFTNMGPKRNVQCYMCLCP